MYVQTLLNVSQQIRGFVCVWGWVGTHVCTLGCTHMCVMHNQVPPHMYPPYVPPNRAYIGLHNTPYIGLHIHVRESVHSTLISRTIGLPFRVWKMTPWVTSPVMRNPNFGLFSEMTAVWDPPPGVPGLMHTHMYTHVCICVFAPKYTPPKCALIAHLCTHPPGVHCVMFAHTCTSIYICRSSAHAICQNLNCSRMILSDVRKILIDLKHSL